MQRFRVAIDIGGTFTDLAAVNEVTGEQHFAKASTTPDDYTRAIVEVLGKLGCAGEEISTFIHGTTLVINSCLERKGARTALISTEGFRDTLEIGRGNRPEAFNYRFKRHQPIVPRELRAEARERVFVDGSVDTPLDEQQLKQTLQELKSKGVESIAICFLHSYRNPEHERRAAEIASNFSDWFVTASYELSGEYREYERSSTTVLNAFVGPKVGSYIGNIEKRLASLGFRGSLFLMQSNGGVSDPETIKRSPALLMESGPVGGIAGAVKIGQSLGYNDIITFDMGGTTAKAALVRHGNVTYDALYYVGGYEHGYPLQMPVVDMLEVGAGGGSIASIDELGALRIGPQSAGAYPGPAAYGLGNEQPTVTDANIYLGRLDTTRFKDAGITLDPALSERALAKLGEKIGYDSRQVAIAICRLANLTMCDALRRVSVERGYDPRGFTMVACGGNGPLHVAELAEDLGCSRILIPSYPAHFSAFGMLMADARYDISQTFIAPLPEGNTPVAGLADIINELHKTLQVSGRKSLGKSRSFSYEDFAEMRYKGQDQTVKVRLQGDYTAASIRPEFDRVYCERYGHVSPIPVQIISVRSSLVAPQPAIPELTGVVRPTSTTKSGVRTVVSVNSGRAMPYQLYNRDQLATNDAVAGPCLIQDLACTINVPEGWAAHAHENQAIELTRTAV